MQAAQARAIIVIIVESNVILIGGGCNKQAGRQCPNSNCKKCINEIINVDSLSLLHQLRHLLAAIFLQNPTLLHYGQCTTISKLTRKICLFHKNKLMWFVCLMFCDLPCFILFSKKNKTLLLLFFTFIAMKCP